jgi:hypothetical protein
MDGETQVRETVRASGDDEDLGGDPLQNVDLTNDDGAALDDQAAFVAAAKAARVPAGQDRGRHRMREHAIVIMTEARIGRLLAASLHQAILEVLPQRLEFYEHWLRSEGLKDGRIGIAPMLAVLGFLRTEGDYERVVARAGSLAADWTLTSMPAVKRRLIGLLPRSLRTRAAVRVVAGIVRDVCSTSRVTTEVWRHTARLDIHASPFCEVREPQPVPLCGFYAAVAAHTLNRLEMPARARVERCRAKDADGLTCVIALDLVRAETAERPAMAA